MQDVLRSSGFVFMARGAPGPVLRKGVNLMFVGQLSASVGYICTKFAWMVAPGNKLLYTKRRGNQVNTIGDVEP